MTTFSLKDESLLTLFRLYVKMSNIRGVLFLNKNIFLFRKNINYPQIGR